MKEALRASFSRCKAKEFASEIVPSGVESIVGQMCAETDFTFCQNFSFMDSSHVAQAAGLAATSWVPFSKYSCTLRRRLAWRWCVMEQQSEPYYSIDLVHERVNTCFFAFAHVTYNLCNLFQLVSVECLSLP